MITIVITINVIAIIFFQTTSELRGELMISMCYNNHLERITIGIFEGRGLLGEAASPIGMSHSWLL